MSIQVKSVYELCIWNGAIYESLFLDALMYAYIQNTHTHSHIYKFVYLQNVIWYIRWRLQVCLRTYSRVYFSRRRAVYKLFMREKRVICFAFVSIKLVSFVYVILLTFSILHLFSYMYIVYQTHTHAHLYMQRKCFIPALCVEMPTFACNGGGSFLT